MEDSDPVEFPFAFAPVISPTRPELHARVGDGSESDEDFALPKPETIGPATTTTPSVSQAMDSKHEGIERPPTDSATSAENPPTVVTAAPKPKFDNKDFLKFPQVRSQKSARWDNITKKDLAWYVSCPVLVVPLSQHPMVPGNIPGDGWIRTYGPGEANNTAPSSRRYVIIQYLPLCCKSYHKPTCDYLVVRGKGVERVIPYNTLMESKKRPKELGPEGRWADTDLHCKRVMKNPKTCSLKSEDWEVTMKWAQMYLDRALELDRERDKKSEQRRKEAEEEHRIHEAEVQKRLELEKARRSRDGVSEGKEGDRDRLGSRTGTGARPACTMVKRTKNLKLAPGDWIFYWDQTKRVGTMEARRNARILEIREEEEAREHGVERLVLDNDEIVLDDWVIQKYVVKKNKRTGAETKVLDTRGNEVRKYKLVPGKLEGVESRGKRLAYELMAGVRQAAKALGAGDQLRNARGFGDAEQSEDSSGDQGGDGGESGDDGDCGADRGGSHVAIPQIAVKDARDDQAGSAVKSSSGSILPKGGGREEDVGDAMAALIASRPRGRGIREGSRKGAAQKQRVLASKDGTNDDGDDRSDGDLVVKRPKKRRRVIESDSDDADDDCDQAVGGFVAEKRSKEIQP